MQVRRNQGHSQAHQGAEDGGHRADDANCELSQAADGALSAALGDPAAVAPEGASLSREGWVSALGKACRLPAHQAFRAQTRRRSAPSLGTALSIRFSSLSNAATHLWNYEYNTWTWLCAGSSPSRCGSAGAPGDVPSLLHAHLASSQVPVCTRSVTWLSFF